MAELRPALDSAARVKTEVVPCAIRFVDAPILSPMESETLVEYAGLSKRDGALADVVTSEADESAALAQVPEDL